MLRGFLNSLLNGPRTAPGFYCTRWGRPASDRPDGAGRQGDKVTDQGHGNGGRGDKQREDNVTLSPNHFVT